MRQGGEAWQAREAEGKVEQGAVCEEGVAAKKMPVRRREGWETLVHLQCKLEATAATACTAAREAEELQRRRALRRGTTAAMALRSMGA